MSDAPAVQDEQQPKTSTKKEPEAQPTAEEEAVDLDKGYPPGEYPEESHPGTFGYVSDAPGVQAGRKESQPEAPQSEASQPKA